MVLHESCADNGSLFEVCSASVFSSKYSISQLISEGVFITYNTVGMEIILNTCDSICQQQSNIRCMKLLTIFLLGSNKIQEGLFDQIFANKRVLFVSSNQKTEVPIEFVIRIVYLVDTETSASLVRDIPLHWIQQTQIPISKEFIFTNIGICFEQFYRCISQNMVSFQAQEEAANCSTHCVGEYFSSHLEAKLNMRTV